MPTKRISTGYEAREQFTAFHQRRQRWAAIVAHRRAGKTVACVNDLIDDALRCTKKNPRFAYIAPFFNQAKDIAWGYVREYTRDIPGVSYNEGELRADLPNGSRVRLYGGDNPDRLRGLYLDGVVLDEPADMDPRLWPEIIRPALSDRKGWAVFIGTPKGRNEFFNIYQNAIKSDDWFALMLQASETGILDADELADARASMTEAQFLQEYECSFEAAILGAYYAHEVSQMRMTGRVTKVPHKPGLPVETWWDLGARKQGRTMAIGFVQRVGLELHAIDFLTDVGPDKGLPHFAKELRRLQQERGYVYSKHVWPHDGDHLQKATGETLADTWTKLMGEKPVVLPVSDVAPGIDAVRNMLSSMWFDSERCEYWVDALASYRAEYDDDKQTYKPHPVPDWASHPADMTRTGAMYEPHSDWGKPLKYSNKGIL